MAKPASSLYLRVGMLVLSGIALAIGFILYLTAGQFGSKADYFETYVGESIVGLDIGAAVRYRGVQIGRVTEITLAAATYDMPEARADRYAMQLVVLRFAIERSRVARIASLDDMVAAGLRARVSSQGITGVSYLEIDILDPARNPPIRVPWRPRYDYIPAVPSTFNQVTSAAEQILRRLERLDIDGLINNSAGLMGISADRSVMAISPACSGKQRKPWPCYAPNCTTPKSNRHWQKCVGRLLPWGMQGA